MGQLRRIRHAQLANWYALLGRQLEAGFSLPDALRQSEGPPETDLLSMAQQLDLGSPLDKVLDAAPNWIPQADRFLLSAGGESGRLPDICEKLSLQHQQLARHQRDLIAAAIYPLIVLHAFFLFWPLVLTLEFSEEKGLALHAALHASLGALSMIIFWSLIFLLPFAISYLPILRNIGAHLLPGLGKYDYHRSLARFSSTLDSLLAAAVPIQEAFGGAALTANHPTLSPALLKLLPHIEKGRPPGGALNQIPGLSPQWIALYQTGERTGSLDRSLQLITRQAEDVAQRTLRSMAFWYPKLLFLLVTLLVGFTVLRVYSQYLDFLGRLSTGNW